jgi:hypothetical protein
MCSPTTTLDSYPLVEHTPDTYRCSEVVEAVYKQSGALVGHYPADVAGMHEGT